MACGNRLLQSYRFAASSCFPSLNLQGCVIFFNHCHSVFRSGASPPTLDRIARPFISPAPFPRILLPARITTNTSSQGPVFLVSTGTVLHGLIWGCRACVAFQGLLAPHHTSLCRTGRGLVVLLCPSRTGSLPLRQVYRSIPLDNPVPFTCSLVLIPVSFDPSLLLQYFDCSCPGFSPGGTGFVTQF